VAQFQALNVRLSVSTDGYIRTTEARHKEVVHELWQRCQDAGDIYLGTYEGWYSEKEETFVKQSDAERWGYKDPADPIGKPLVWTEEEAYFFRCGKYRAAMRDHILQHERFIQPEVKRQEVLTLLEDERHEEDLCISRTSFSWGIPVPPGCKEGHVIYVWFDAVANYLSGLDKERETFWPHVTHIIGKDIVRFHAVIWPAILLSAGLPLPEAVFAHGFVCDSQGIKGSKSFGNSIDPHKILARYPVDSLRWYFSTAAVFGADLRFSESELCRTHNTLTDTLGNLVSRVTALCEAECDGVVPHPAADCERGLWQSFGTTEAWPHHFVTKSKPRVSPVDSNIQAPITFDPAALREAVTYAFAENDLHRAANCILECTRATNAFLTEAQPWALRASGRKQAARGAVVDALEAIYFIAHLFAPFIPHTATDIFRCLGQPPQNIPALSCNLANLRAGSVVKHEACLLPLLDELTLVRATVADFQRQHNLLTAQLHTLRTVNTHPEEEVKARPPEEEARLTEKLAEKQQDLERVAAQLQEQEAKCEHFQDIERSVQTLALESPLWRIKGETPTKAEWAAIEAHSTREKALLSRQQVKRERRYAHQCLRDSGSSAAAYIKAAKKAGIRTPCL